MSNTLLPIIENKLKSLNFKFTKTGDNFIMTKCLNPEHKDTHPSFSINTETGFGKCFTCNFKVNSDYWLKNVLDEEMISEINRNILYQQVEEAYIKTEKSHSFKHYLPPYGGSLKKPYRGLSPEFLKEQGIYYCNKGLYANRLIFPYYSYNRELQGFNSRLIKSSLIDPKTNPKYKYSKGLKPEDIIYPLIKKNTDYIIIVEGIMDALSGAYMGLPTIMNFGVNNTIKSKKIKEFLRLGVDTIYIALDNDKAGEEGIKRYKEDKELNSIFSVKTGKDCPELKNFYDSNVKDLNDFLVLFGRNGLKN